MTQFIDLCLRIPNLGTIAYLLVFVLIIPSYLISSNSTDAFKYYLPFLVMLAVTLTESGSPDIFHNLYPENPRNLAGFLSKNLINGLAVFGLLLQCISLALFYNNLLLGVLVGLITFSITFPMAQQVLPYFIREGDFVLKERTDFLFPGNWHKYFLGFMFIILLLTLEYVMIIAVGEYVFSIGNIKSSGVNSIVKNSLNLN
jgi:hypothetical protein